MVGRIDGSQLAKFGDEGRRTRDDGRRLTRCGRPRALRGILCQVELRNKTRETQFREQLGELWPVGFAEAQVGAVDFDVALATLEGDIAVNCHKLSAEGDIVLEIAEALAPLALYLVGVPVEIVD